MNFGPKQSGWLINQLGDPSLQDGLTIISCFEEVQKELVRLNSISFSFFYLTVEVSEEVIYLSMIWPFGHSCDPQPQDTRTQLSQAGGRCLWALAGTRVVLS